MPAASQPDDSDDLWQFSATLYAADEVKDWCLFWQGEYKADVTLLLWLCWMEHRRGVHLDTGQIARAISVVADWRQNIIEPVRHARTHLKTIRESLPSREYGDIRGKLLETELAAERMEQSMLLRSFVDMSQNPAQPGESNIMRYLGLLTDRLSADDRRRSEQISKLSCTIEY